MLSGPALNLQSGSETLREGRDVLKVTEGVVAGPEPRRPGSQVTDLPCLSPVTAFC